MIAFEVGRKFHPVALVMSVWSLATGPEWDTDGFCVDAVVATGERYTVSTHFFHKRARAAVEKYRREVGATSPSEFAATHHLDALASALRSEPPR